MDFDVHDSTTLPISGYYVAMCGDDEVARNGGAGSKEWREVVWGVGSVNLDRQNAERV